MQTIQITKTKTANDALKATTDSVVEVAAAMKALTACYASLLELAKTEAITSDAATEKMLDVQACFADLGVAAIDAATNVSAAMRRHQEHCMAS